MYRAVHLDYFFKLDGCAGRLDAHRFQHFLDHVSGKHLE